MLPLFILNHQTPNDNPPSYDSLKEGSDGTCSSSFAESSLLTQPVVPKPDENRDNKHPPQLHSMIPGPSSYSIHPGTTTGPSPVLYHYRNPLTQDTVVSLLPPDHPEMICLQSGEHITQTKFGILGKLHLYPQVNQELNTAPLVRHPCCGFLVSSWRRSLPLGS